MPTNPQYETTAPVAGSLALVPPNTDPARNAIHAIRGYEYQALAATLAWIRLDDQGKLYLEVAEDYAKVVGQAIEAVQVKDTGLSGAVTLSSSNVRNAIASFVDLVERNPDQQVQLRFLTTSAIGLERATRDRPGGLAGLKYWQRVRLGQEVVGPLRSILEREPFPDAVRKFCAVRSDTQLTEELIRRVTWDCDCPNATNLRIELEQHLTLVLRDQFGIPSQEVPRIADTLAYRVLQKSSLPDPPERVLTRSELHQLVDSTTRLSLPRASLEPLLARLAGRQSGDEVAIRSPSNRVPHWFIDASEVPAPKTFIARPAVEEAVQTALKSAGVCFIFGTTGVGKSMVARTIASGFQDPVRWIDSRHADFREAQIRLNQTLSLLAGMAPSTLIVEDLNLIEEPTVQISLAQVIEAAHRHDMRVLITCYRPPSATVLNGLGLDSECVVACPHFDQEETDALVKHAGGNPALWGRVAHVAGGTGHPQLTHAFVVGMAAKAWPEDEIAQIFALGFTSADLEATREAARISLINSMPEPTRDLLYRLSTTTGFFKRSLAIAIGAVSPPIPRASECFDQLVGSWIEPATTDRFRSSPLARGFGPAMLTPEEQRQVHHTIATQMFHDTPIDVSDIDTILVHGLAGNSEDILLRLSHLINAVDDKTHEGLGKHLIAFRLLDTSKPIYPKDLPISAMLRLAQFRLVAASDEPERSADVANALLRDAEAIPRDLVEPDLEIAVAASILNNIGIANHIQGWVGLLSRFRNLFQSDEDAEWPLGGYTTTASPTAMMFNIGIVGLESVQKLEAIFHDIATLEPEERRELLTPINQNYADYQTIVHHPWVTEARQPAFDADSAASRYERMAREAQAWGNRALSLQCSVASAAILDELKDDAQAALHVLNAAEASYGKDLILARAFAKLHHRNGQHAEALEFYGETVPHIEAASPIYAVHTLRDAAICAAMCGDWPTARSWFLRAQGTVRPLQNIELDSLRIGLGADAAVASFETGDLQDALSLLKEALLALAEIDPQANLQAAYCHRVVRHTILWLQAKADGRDTKVQGKPLSMIPGACSNPEPIREIQQHPLGHVDFAWYILAEIETTAGLGLGIRATLKQITAQGHIPLCEHGLRLHVLSTDIERLDPTRFSNHLSDYVASAVYCHANSAVLRDSFNVMDPERVVIPALPCEGPFNPVAERTARQAILAYGVRALFEAQIDAMFRLRDALTSNLGRAYPGMSLFDTWTAPASDRSDLDDEIAAILPDCLRSSLPQPELLFRAGLRLLDWTAQSQFRPVLLPLLAPWLRVQWQRVLAKQRFRLHNPRSTVPPIDAVLKSQAQGEHFAAQLALVADVAVGVRLSNSLRKHLLDLAGYSRD